jgi:hypothetical protein
MAAKFKANGIDYQIIEVKLNKSASVTQYVDDTKGTFAKLWKECTDLNNWSVQIDRTGRIIEGHPSTPAHPGHVQGADWKMNIEAGNNTVDRLSLIKRTYTVVDKTPTLKHIKISATGIVDVNTH